MSLVVLLILSPHPLNLPKQCHQLRNKYSNARAYGGWRVVVAHLIKTAAAAMAFSVLPRSPFPSSVTAMALPHCPAV